MEEMEGDGGTVSSGCWIFTLPSIGVSVKGPECIGGREDETNPRGKTCRYLLLSWVI